ncbi:MAG: redoxin domain-containing protein [Candidatus Sulfobium sp.]|jgi:peroxiredoxin
MKVRVKILAVVAIAFLAAMNFSLSTAAASAGEQEAADFSLKDLGGKTITLSSLKGKVVILNFWATWCPSCVSEMPSLNTLYKEMKSRGLEVIAVSTDRSASSVGDFKDTHGLAFPVVMDEDREVTRLYHVFSLPTSFLINKKGIIVEKFYGEYDWTEQEMKEKIEKLF